MKKGSKKMIFLFCLYVILSSSGLILFKLGTNSTNLSITIFSNTINFSSKMIIGILCYGISFLLWMYIVSKVNLTIATPLSVALVNTFVLIGSCIILKEKITFIQGIGIFLVLFGVILISIRK